MADDQEEQSPQPPPPPKSPETNPPAISADDDDVAIADEVEQVAELNEIITTLTTGEPDVTSGDAAVATTEADGTTDGMSFQSRPLTVPTAASDCSIAASRSKSSGDYLAAPSASGETDGDCTWGAELNMLPGCVGAPEPMDQQSQQHLYNQKQHLQQLQQQQRYAQQQQSSNVSASTPTSAQFVSQPSLQQHPQQAATMHSQYPSQHQAQHQQWTVQENGMTVQVTSVSTANGQMSLTLPSGAVITLQSNSMPVQQQQQPHQQFQHHQHSSTSMQQPQPQMNRNDAAMNQNLLPSESVDYSMGPLPLGEFHNHQQHQHLMQQHQPMQSQSQSQAQRRQQQEYYTPSSQAQAPSQPKVAPQLRHHRHIVSNPDPPAAAAAATAASAAAAATAPASSSDSHPAVPFIPSLQTTPASSFVGGGNDHTPSAEQRGLKSKNAVIRPRQGAEHVAELMADPHPQIGNMESEETGDSADAAAGAASRTSSPRKMPAQPLQLRLSEEEVDLSSLPPVDTSIDRKPMPKPKEKLIRSTSKSSVFVSEGSVEVQHLSQDAGSKSASSSEPSKADAAGGVSTSSSDKSFDMKRAAQSDVEAEASADVKASSSAQDPAPAVAPAPPKSPPKYQPRWLTAKEEDYEEPAQDPGKVYFVMNRQSNRNYMATAMEVPSLPQKDSALTDKPYSQLELEEAQERERRAHAQAAARAQAALEQQQFEAEMAYMQQRHVDLTGQFIYQRGSWDDQSDVSSITMGMHDLGVAPQPLAHTPAHVYQPDNTDGQATYAQSVEWAKLTAEQKAAESAKMAERSGGALGLPQEETVVETMVKMFTTECHSTEPVTKKVAQRSLRQLGAMQPYSARTIRNHTGVYRPAAAAASSTRLATVQDCPSSPKSAKSGPSSTGSTGAIASVGSKVAKPVSPLKSLRSIRGLHGGIS